MEGLQERPTVIASDIAQPLCERTNEYKNFPINKEELAPILFPLLENPESPTYLPDVTEAELQAFRKIQFDQDEVLNTFGHLNNNVNKACGVDTRFCRFRGFKNEDIPVGGAFILAGEPRADNLSDEPVNMHKSHRQVPVFVLPKQILPTETFNIMFPNIPQAGPEAGDLGATRAVLIGSLIRSGTEHAGDQWSSVVTNTYAVRGVFLMNSNHNNAEAIIHAVYLSQEEIDILGTVRDCEDLKKVNDSFENLSRIVKAKLAEVEDGKK